MEVMQRGQMPDAVKRMLRGAEKTWYVELGQGVEIW